MMLWGRSPQSVWKRGERAAEKHLRKQGIKVLARNMRLPVGEIDLLCHDRAADTIVIVEVKARSYAPDSKRDIDPAANITHHKQRKLVQLAKSIKKMSEFASRPIRIDVVSVRFIEGQRGADIRHYPGCVSDS